MFYYSIDFKDFALDLLNVVNDQEMDFHEDTPVFRPPATSLSGHVFEVHLWILKPPAFLFYSDTSCSTDVCPPALVFPTKAKYQRHWSENHLPEVVSYSCPVYLCKIDCRQRYDMKVHLLRVSNTANGLVGSIFFQESENTRPNRSFINPGWHVYFLR